MPHEVHLVFSLPPADVTREAYADFYDMHVAEILQTPGYASARRYWLGEPAPDRPIVFRHLTVYVLDRPFAQADAELGRRMEAGELTLPEWFGDIRFQAFAGRPLEDEELELPEHGYLVLSHAPQRFNTDEFYGWYYAHARENLTSDGFHSVRRFALTPVVIDPQAPSGATHGAFYVVDGELPELRAALQESARAGRVDIPAWMDECEFVSYDCRAAAGPA
jgi:hypothetical protein